MAALTCKEAGAASGLDPRCIARVEGGEGLLIFADALPLARAYRLSLPELARRFERDLSAAQEVQQ